MEFYQCEKTTKTGKQCKRGAIKDYRCCKQHTLYCQNPDCSSWYGKNPAEKLGWVNDEGMRFYVCKDHRGWHDNPFN